MSWLDDLLGKSIKKNGSAYPDRKVLNLIEGAGTGITVADNTSTGETDVTITNTLGAVTHAARTIWGRAGATSGVAADIAATNASDDVLRESGGTVAFGKIKPKAVSWETSNGDAVAGAIGEVVFLDNTGSPTTLTTTVVANVASVSLTAGDWDVSANFIIAGNLTGTKVEASLTSTTAGSGSDGYTRSKTPTMPTTAAPVSLSIPTVRFKLTTTTTIYLTASATFTVGTATAAGSILARRAR